MTVTADAPVIITGPGIYPDLSEDAYHADPVPGGSLSSGGARKLLPPSCPARFKHERDNPTAPTESMELGSAAHKLVLGVGAEIEIIDAENWRTKASREAADEARAAGRIPLLPADYSIVQAMATALRGNDLARFLLSSERGGYPEQSLFAVDDETRVWCRVRLDWMPDERAQLPIIADYKGLELGTPLPTPTGWTTMRAVRVGDQLLGSDGNPCAVTAKSEVHYRKTYRVRFDDGSTVVCDDEHLWLTTSGGTQNKTRTAVRSTEKIKQTLRLYGQCHHRVPVASPLSLPDLPLPIDPYVLGCWIGDGNTADGRITSADPEIYERIAARGYGMGTSPPSALCPIRTIYGLTTHLKKAGVLGHKSIPAPYLRSGYAQRLDLLRGLMDTDGSWNSTRNQAVFTTADKALGAQVRELALSLGQRAILHTVKANGFGLHIEAYRVTFTPTGGLNPFALSRKADRVSAPARTNSTRRVIVAVDETVTVATQCLAVDSADRTYLCTEAMIPTHNTSDSCHSESFARSAARYGYHVQEVFYRRVYRQLTGRDVDFLFVVQEKAPPYLVNVCQLNDSSVQAGETLVRRALQRYRDCTESGVWPGYDADTEDGIAHIDLPRWAMPGRDW